MNMIKPTINMNNLNNNINFEPSDDELKRIEEEVDKLLNTDNK